MNELKVKVTRERRRKYLIMYYDDPVTGKRERRSTKETTRREAERAAAKWEAELQTGRYRRDSRILWPDFRARYEDEHMATLAEMSQRTYPSAMNHLERLVPRLRKSTLASLTTETLSTFQRKLRDEGMKPTTIAAKLRVIRAALRWAVSMKLLAEAPIIRMPKRAKGQRLMRGRPITGEEFERMLDKTADVRPSDAPAWRRYLTGLWFSGLRLRESLILSWDADAPIALDLRGKHPRLRIYAEAQKGHRDQLLPITPDFARFLLETPEAERHGPVFKLRGQTDGNCSAYHAGPIITKIGRAAGVVVNKAAGKFASAHDLRRSFGTRWAARVMPAVLQKLMRHQSIETTMRYYVEQNADDLASVLWATDDGVRTFVRTNPFGGGPADETRLQESTQAPE